MTAIRKLRNWKESSRHGPEVGFEEIPIDFPPSPFLGTNPTDKTDSFWLCPSSSDNPPGQHLHPLEARRFLQIGWIEIKALVLYLIPSRFRSKALHLTI